MEILAVTVPDALFNPVENVYDDPGVKGRISAAPVVRLKYITLSGREALAPTPNPINADRTHPLLAMAFILFWVLFCLLLIIELFNEKVDSVNRTVPFYQLLLSMFIVFLGGVGIWVALNRELESVVKTNEFQQKQIEELKTTTSQIQGTMDDIKEGMGDIRGDVKVILSKIQ